MKIIRITGVLSLILLFSFVKPESKRSGEDYHLKVDEAHFEITFPVSESHVKNLTNVQLVDEEEIKIYNYIAVMQGTSDENVSYQFVAQKLLGPSTEDDAEGMFEDSRNQILNYMEAQMGGEGATVTLESEQKIELDGVPGRSWITRIKHSEMIHDIVMYTKIFCTKEYIYKLIIMNQNSNFPNKSGLKFFNLFKISSK